LETYSFSSADQYVQQLSQEYGLEGVTGALFGSAEYDRVSSGLKDGQSSYGYAQLEFTLYELSLQGMPQLFPLSPSFLYSLSQLPDDYDESIYFDFLRQWGTHVVTSAKFGGEGTLHMFTAVSYAESSGTIQTQLGYMFADFMSAQNTASQDFTERSVAYFSVQGGSYEEFEIGGWNQWAEEVYEAPIQVSATMQPITLFVHKTLTQQNLAKAIDIYMASNNPIPQPEGIFTTSFQRSSNGYASCGATNISVTTGFDFVTATGFVAYPTYCSSGSISKKPLSWPLETTRHQNLGKTSYCPYGQSVLSYTSSEGCSVGWVDTCPCGDVLCASWAYEVSKD